MVRAGKRKADQDCEEDNINGSTRLAGEPAASNVSAYTTEKRARLDSESNAHTGHSPLSTLAESSSSITANSDSDQSHITNYLIAPTSNCSTSPPTIELRTSAVNGVSDEVLARLRAFANHSSVANNSYSLGLLPENCGWGERRALTDRSSFWCSSDGRHPITIWLLGKIIDTAFECNGEPVKMVGIQIEPLTASAGNDAKAIIGGKSFPVTLYAERWSSLKATCFTSSYRDQGRSVPRPFTAVYDGTQQFRSDKSAMHAYPARDLKVEDIVLVEAHIRRFVPSNLNNGTNTWDSWRVKFELVAVSIVCKALATNPEQQQATTTETKEDVII